MEMTEQIFLIDKPQPQFKFLEANRLLNLTHVRNIMRSMQEGEWIQPIYVTKHNYVVDGNHRYRAFCNLLCTDPNFKGFLRVIYIDSNENPVKLAIKFNTGHKSWTAKDYLHAYVCLGIWSYIHLAKFLNTYKYMNIKSAIQLITGKYDEKAFKDGFLDYSPANYADAVRMVVELDKINTLLKCTYACKRDAVLGFRDIYTEISTAGTFDWQSFSANFSKFEIPVKHTRFEWYRAYQEVL